LIQSQALQANISNIDVDIAPRYIVIQEVMSRYFGLTEGVTTFLKELSHPQKNLQFIVKEARNYALNYFHLMNDHADGGIAAQRFADIFLCVIQTSPSAEIRSEAADNLLLFIEKIIREAKPGIEKFIGVLNQAFERIAGYDDANFFLFVKSYYRLEKIAESLLRNSSELLTSHFSLLTSLLIRYYRHTYAYWLNQADPWEWFKAESGEVNNGLDAFFTDISLNRIREIAAELEKISQNTADPLELLKGVIRLPAYNHFTDSYRNIPQRLMKFGSKCGRGMRWKFIFLFHILNIAGLSAIHEEALREINRSLIWLIAHENHLNIEKIMQKTFSILKARIEEFPDTALNCILNMGQGVYKTDESDLINLFIDSVLDLGFQTPGIGGVGNDWQIRVNPAHIQNIRVWLELICLNPKYSTRLLSSLTIYLSLYGVFIKDTELFPRNITALLNSKIGPVYNLVKQLARLFPVYFNDIGAEGSLRDISTRIDEITHRRDVLVHFLRKQTHVESSNRVIGFIEAVFLFWQTKDKKCLEPFVPPNIYEQINADGHYIDGMNRIFSYLAAEKDMMPEQFLAITEEELTSAIAEISDISADDAERAMLAVSFYKLLHQKYNISASEIHHYLIQLSGEGFPNIHKLRSALEETDIREKVFRLLEFLETLKEMILSSKTYEIRENIYKKRHFTVDIPSMYGNYHEIKFDALGLTFRVESLINVLFEQIIESIDLSLITKAAFEKIYDVLILFNKALRADGIASVEFERQLDLLNHSLEARGFTFTQYLDIFKGFVKAVTNIVNDHFTNIHEKNLDKILSRLHSERILPKYLSSEQSSRDDERFGHRVSEVFFRDRIALCIGLQQLDVFFGRILKTLYDQSYKVPSGKLRLLLNYDPKRAMMSIDRQDDRSTSIIYLGNKGFNLVKLHNFGFPIPPGFIITTEIFRCRDIIAGYRPAEKNFREQVAAMISHMETLTGKKFADPSNPLVFSVRSGSSISQPGMMDTFLNVGMNEEIAEGLARKTGNGWFAWDNYRRFLQCYGMSYDLNRDDFDAIIKEHKKRCNIPLKRGFTGDQMRLVALAYKNMVRDSGIDIPEDPFEQLMMTIKQVLNSWDFPKAQAYRQIMGISDDWGTAVTVQSMVFGNMSRQSGTGVFFTHNPKWSEDSLRLWGDFTLGNQGEDVVSGLVNTLPISIIQQDSEMRDTDTTLESHFPKIYNALKELAGDLIYKKGWSPQEMEFTFEGPTPDKLYLLQTRDMAMRELKKAPVFDSDSVKGKSVMGNGIGVCGGAMSGRVVFTLDEISDWRRREPDTTLILLRNDTVPDDIREVNAADGLLTARGGMTSHAAVVAHRLGKTCVVGCGNLICNEEQKNCVFNNELFIKSGDYLSIDGREGVVYHGFIPVREEQS